MPSYRRARPYDIEVHWLRVAVQSGAEAPHLLFRTLGWFWHGSCLGVGMEHLVVVESGAVFPTRISSDSVDISILMQGAHESAQAFRERFVERMKRSDSQKVSSVELVCSEKTDVHSLAERRRLARLILKTLPDKKSSMLHLRAIQGPMKRHYEKLQDSMFLLVDSLRNLGVRGVSFSIQVAQSLSHPQQSLRDSYAA